MKGMGKFLAVAAVAVLASACESSPWVSTWKAADAQPLQITGEKVVAVVMINDRSTRRTAEDTLAAEITRRGAQGVAMYTLQEDDAKPSAEAATPAPAPDPNSARPQPQPQQQQTEQAQMDAIRKRIEARRAQLRQEALQEQQQLRRQNQKPPVK